MYKEPREESDATDVAERKEWVPREGDISKRLLDSRTKSKNK